MNRNRNIIILIIAIIGVAIVDVINVNNPIFVLVFSLLMFIAFTLGINFLIYRDKNKSISWLTKKLDDTKETLRKKDVAEKRMVEELPIGIIIYDDHYHELKPNHFLVAILKK